MKMKKYIIAMFAACVFTAAGFAQDAAVSESQIELPDLTTVVSGASDSEDYAPPPSFDDVLELPEKSGELVPALPAAAAGSETDVVNATDDAMQKDIYAEGKIGGGYPASFTGDFQIARLYGADPFKISFTHESASGFAGHNLADGYNNSDTAIALEKDFIRQNINWGFAARYEDISNGLQSKAEGVAGNNQDAVGVSANFLWQLPKDFKLGFDVDSEFYYRFADITKTSTPGSTVPDWIISTSRVTSDPSLVFGWGRNGFEIDLDANYNLEAWKKVSNRGQFDLDLSWKNDKVKLYSEVGIVIGNFIGSQKLLVPFTVGLDAVLPVYFSDRKLNLSINGGLASNRQSTAALERSFKFSGLQDFATETSDWYGNLNLLVPLKSSFTGNIAAGFLHTAYDNGVWTPDYSDASLASGIYTFSQKNRFELFTDFAFTWKYKLFAATAKYHANWIDLPVLENRHTISVDFALQSDKGKWGVDLDTIYLLDASDFKPVINLEGFVQAASSVRIVLSVNDLLKLLGAEERGYAGQYAANSGNATLLVKFLF